MNFSKFTSTLFVGLGLCASLSARAIVREGCGLEGTPQEKIENCRANNGSLAFRYAGDPTHPTLWALVTKLSTLECFNENETWLDTATGLAWSPEFGERYTYKDASNTCSLMGPKTRLPLATDFETAETHGLREVFPSMDGKIYWTGTQADPDFPKDAYFFSGRGGYLDKGNRDLGHNVRCVEDTAILQ